MDFISGIFILFLCIGLILYYSIPKKGQWIWLLLLSMFFYVYASPKLCIFILFSAISSFIGARVVRKYKWILWLVIVANGGILFGLKVAASQTPLAVSLHLDRFAFLLPMGISFYTLQIIAYMVDVYKERIEPEKNFFHYLLFVTYFPQILQGPIPRFDKLEKQLIDEHKFDYQQFVNGFEYILWGYFQKLVVADRANIMVNKLFNEYQNYTGLYMLIAGVLYSIQLYADFNGCVCIAMGVSQMFGIELENNFKQPYFSLSIQDFWRRWHISLSSWLKDYIYIPLGGNRKGVLRKYINIMLTFIVSGIWHGIGLHYLVWGMLHGFYQVIGNLMMPVRNLVVRILQIDRTSFSHRLFKQITTFFMVMIAWIFFRASSISQALNMIKSMFMKWNPWILWDQSLYQLDLDAKNVWLLVFGIIVMYFVSFMQTRFQIREELSKQGLIFKYLIVYIAIFAILIFGIYGPGYDSTQFIYGGF